MRSDDAPFIQIHDIYMRVFTIHYTLATLCYDAFADYFIQYYYAVFKKKQSCRRYLRQVVETRHNRCIKILLLHTDGKDETEDRLQKYSEYNTEYSLMSYIQMLN
jgi:hypothetical protein